VVNDTAQGPTFDWTSTSLVAAIFVKGGPDGNLYDYRPDGALADTGLHAPVNDSNGKYYGLSHLTFCIPDDVPVEPEGLLAVVKTADGTFDRTHDWSIEKSVDPEEIDLIIGGETETAAWDIVVTYEGSEDSNHAVTGTIEITNGETEFNAEIDSVVDSLGDVDCGVTFLHTLAPGDTLECDYSIDTDQGGTNEVTVAGEYVSLKRASSGPIAW
jgi:hypothetical protein